MPDAVVTGAVGIVGVVMTAPLAEWRVRGAEARAQRRAQDSESKSRRLEAIRQTRLRAADTIERLRGAAISGMFDKRPSGMFGVGVADQLVVGALSPRVPGGPH
jgi:hypothetical protein